MKNYAIAAAVILAACSGAPEEQPAAEDAPVAEAVAITAADGQPPEGTYEITTSDGTVFTQTVNADGTYTNSSADGETTTGTWMVDSPNRWCSKKDDETEMTCYNEQVDAEGVWTSVDENDAEDVSTVKRVTPQA